MPIKTIHKIEPSSLIQKLTEIRKNSSLGDQTQLLTDSSGISYTLGLSTPKSLKPDSLYPLIIYLHGGIGTTLNTKGEKAFKMLSFLQDSIDLFLCSPSANRFSPWWSSLGLQRTLQSLRYMVIHYPIDTNRIFLAGVSDGATGCYAAANTISGPFAGFWAISGFGGMLPSLGMPLFPSNLKSRPIYNINAGLDHLYPIEMVNSFLYELEKQGVTITKRTYPDEKHGFDYREKETETLLSFLKSWKKVSPSYSKWVIVPGYPNVTDYLISYELPTTISGNTSFSISKNNDSVYLFTENLKSLTFHYPSLNKNKELGYINSQIKNLHDISDNSFIQFEYFLSKQFISKSLPKIYKVKNILD